MTFQQTKDKYLQACMDLINAVNTMQSATVIKALRDNRDEWKERFETARAAQRTRGIQSIGEAARKML